MQQIPERKQVGDGRLAPPRACRCPINDAATTQAEKDIRGDGERRHHQGNPISVESIAKDEISVGAGGNLVVPREDIGEGIAAESDLVAVEEQRLKVRKPGRREWIAVDPTSELPTRLLIHKSNPDGIETEHYYVLPRLRGPIADELKPVRVYCCYSFADRRRFLWIINVSDSTWYDSLLPLLDRPRDFFEVNAVRIIPDKKESEYRIRVKPLPADPVWTGRSMEDLLGQAIGPDHFIASTEHQLYRELIEGQEL